MPEPLPHHPEHFTARADQPLIGVIRQRNGQELVEYFTDEAELDASRADDGIQAALNLAGAWKDIDSPDFLDELDRIRHASKPTPPIDLSEFEP
jgi:hypothetical protein